MLLAMERCSNVGPRHLKCPPQQRLENIREEDEGGAGWLPVSLQPPETPTETMEFLARSWSLSATELSKALGEVFPPHPATEQACSQSTEPALPSDDKLPETVPVEKKVALELSPTAESFVISPPISPRDYGDLKELLRGTPPGKMAKGGWLKDHKEKKRAEARSHNAQVYAAASVAGVAAAVAAAAAGSVFSPDVLDRQASGTSKLGAAVASATALVASHCVEMAQAMGASRDQILAVIRSAVNAQTPGDIITLTAGAATALRAAATLRMRIHKDIQGTTLTGEIKESSALTFVYNGGELLKRTRKGILHWKQVSVYINSSWQVVVKMKSTHMAGTFVKKKKSVVTDVHSDIPSWPKREAADGSSQRPYFGIKTPERLIEFECRSKYDKQIWVKGIEQMLNCCVNMNVTGSM